MPHHPDHPVQIHLALAGSVVPRSFIGEYPSVKSPTIEIQQNLLDGLIREGLAPGRVFTTLPVRRYPYDRRWFLAHRPVEYAPDVGLTFLGWINLEPLKTLSIGIDGFLCVLAWGIGQRLHGRRPALLLYNLGPTHHQVGFFWLAAHLTGTRIYSLVTDLYPPEGGWFGPDIGQWLSYAVQRFCLRRLDGMIALNELAIRDFAPGKPHLHLHGLVPDDERVRELAGLPFDQRAPGEPFVIGYMGSLNQLRGLDLLLEAFSGAPPHWRLLIAGKGEMEDLVKRAVQTDSRIEHAGFLAQASEITAFMKRCNCLVNPHRVDDPASRYVFPSKLTEYMAAGRPVVSTNQGNVSAIYRDFLWISASDAPESLRVTLAEVDEAGPELRCQRVSAAREHVLANKLWLHHGRRIADFIRQQEA